MSRSAGMLIFSDLPKRKRFRLKLRVLFLVVGIIAAFITSILFEEKHYYWAILPGSFILLASLAEFVLADILTESLYPANTQTLLQKLESNLQGAHDKIRDSIARAIGSLRACDVTKVSGTFHLKVELYSSAGDESESALVQVTDYSGRLGGKRWRFTIATKGLIGRCLRTERPEGVNFGSQMEYEERMVKEFGFSPTEVAQHTQQARSYWAQPVHSRGRLVGIIFLFSTDVQVFPLAADRIRLEGTANEIAAYLEGAGIV
jgi:hypothetical protein